MQAFLVEEHGKGLPLRLVDRPEPQPGPSDLLVRVLASGLDPLDPETRDGEPPVPLPYETPSALGLVTMQGS